MSDPVPSGREVIARITAPSGEWQLQRRDLHYEIICNGVFLMASYNRESDRQLAQLALARVAGEDLRVLVGGLGIGYTLQAVLEDRRVGAAEVVEVEPLVVDWHHEFFAPLCNSPCDDPRTQVVVSDLVGLPLTARSYDAILLDTDNGPDWLALDRNAQLYDAEGIARFLGLLRPGGILAYWSASEAPTLLSRLRGAGEVEALAVDDEIAPGRTGRAFLYFARSGG